MRTIQAELWKRITVELSEYGDLYALNQFQEMSEAERLYEDMCDKFGATLTGDQKMAFSSLMNIFDADRFAYQEMGVALGMCFAEELHKLLDDPAAAYRQACAGYIPVAERYKLDIQALKGYFKASGTDRVKVLRNQ